MPLRLAVIGDIHGCWTAADTAYFNGADYAAVLFVGDLPPFTGSVPVARRLSELRVPAYLVPGNHDACTPLQFIAELRHREALAALLSRGHEKREAALRAALSPVRLVGYSLDLLEIDGAPLGLIAARPYSMGGDRLYFRGYLERRWNVRSFEDSAARLCALVDAAPRDVLFLAHNGPSGLGSARDDIYGCDFSRNGSGDFGDPDLRAAITHARNTGRRVHAVVAGHMHHRLKSGGERAHWQVEGDGTLYVNAARVRRIKQVDGFARHHHVALTLGGADGPRAEATWVPVPATGSSAATAATAPSRAKR